MVGTAELLTAFEECPRKAYWLQSWERYKMTPAQILQKGVSAGVTESNRTDWGQLAGEVVYGCGVEPGIISEEHDLHSEIVHIACVADIVSCAIRRPKDAPWKDAEVLDTWEPSNLFTSPDGRYLRRVIFTTNWSDDKHYSICRSWHSIGAVCHYGLGMQLLIVVLGQHRSGRYHSFWSKGLRHPVSKQLRFRKKTDKATPFKESWRECWREDYDELSTTDWLSAMYSDGVLQDCCFTIDLPVPSDLARQRVLDLAKMKLDKIDRMKSIPDENLSSCSWPTKCTYIRPCHNGEQPSGRYGFVPVEDIA